MKNKKNVGLYVHIPFCKQKCKYCDFKSYVGKENSVDTYIKWLNYEIKEIGEGNRLDYENNLDDLAVIDTIYIGGGTPSYIESKYIKNIMNTIKENYTLEENVEVTIEVNPGTVTEEKLLEYKDAGINRLSIGLQASQKELLEELGRIHNYDEFENTYNLARKLGFKNINVDLMIGLPKQSMEDIKQTINKIIMLEPEHISVYSLIVENETLLYKEIENNILKLPSDELERKMYWYVKNELEKDGYIHYEISNFAKVEYESKHNMNCWKQREYIGVGVAAHSYTNGVRFSNVDTIEEYISNYEKSKEEDNLIFHEKQNKESMMKEYMMLGLRIIDGIKIQDFKNKFGENPIFIYRNELNKLVKSNLIKIDADVIKLTKKGLDLANLVWEEFI